MVCLCGMELGENGAISFENDVVLSIDCEEEPLGFEIVVISKEEFEEILSKHGYARRIRGFDDCSVAEK